jgi:hypothetical protein
MVLITPSDHPAQAFACRRNCLHPLSAAGRRLILVEQIHGAPAFDPRLTLTQRPRFATIRWVLGWRLFGVTSCRSIRSTNP